MTGIIELSNSVTVLLPFCFEVIAVNIFYSSRSGALLKLIANFVSIVQIFQFHFSNLINPQFSPEFFTYFVQL